MLTFTQTHTNWQKEDGRKEQSVTFGWVTFSPSATSQVSQCVCLCVCVQVGQRDADLRECLYLTGSFGLSTDAHVLIFACANICAGGRQRSRELCGIMRDSVREAMFEVRALCAEPRWGGLTFSTSLFMTGGKRRPHSNITSCVAGASLGRKGWQPRRERMRDLNSGREEGFYVRCWSFALLLWAKLFLTFYISIACN